MGGGFSDPFAPAPAWPQDLVVADLVVSASVASSLADSAGLGEFHLQNDSSPALLNGRAKDIMSSLELNQQLLQEQLQAVAAPGLTNFEAERALTAGTLGSLLSMPSPMSLADSATVLCSSNVSGGSDQSCLPQFLFGEQQVPAPDAWSSAFLQAPPLFGEGTSQSFGLGAVGNGDFVNEACTQDAKNYPQLLGNVPSAPLQQLHDGANCSNGKMLSFAHGQQQLNTNFDNLQIHQKGFSGLRHLNLSSSLVSGQLSSFNATGPALSPKQSNEENSGINGLASALVNPSEVPNGNANAGNGAPKPRIRARRGQATDPHSIQERLRREKISDRMKNLQELVPNSNKTDKASMLDEIIDYVKFLQLQVKVLSMSRLGSTEAVVPLLTESHTESSGFLVTPKSGNKKAGANVPGQSELGDGAAFEQEVAQLMENNMTTAMQYLQSKGLCLMPIALASAISDQKGTSSMAVRPENGGAVDGSSKGNAKNVPVAMKPFGIAKARA